MALLCSSFDGSACFPDVDGIGAAFAMEFVDAFTFAWRRTSFVFGAEHVLEFVTSLVEKVAASLGKSPLELMGDTGYETESGIWTEPYVFLSLRVEWECLKEVSCLLLL